MRDGRSSWTTGQVPVPGEAGEALMSAAVLVAPLLHPDCGLSTHPTPDELGRMLQAVTADASTSTAMQLPPFRQAVYVTYDVWGACRYVGSVARVDAAAVATRLREHYRGHGGSIKKQTWKRVVVFGLLDSLSIEAVRRVEGRVAYKLNPLDGQAHPTFVTGTDLASLL